MLEPLLINFPFPKIVSLIKKKRQNEGCFDEQIREYSE